MTDRITYASVCGGGRGNMEINTGGSLVFICGKEAENVLLALAGLFGNLPENCFSDTEEYSVKADIVWSDGVKGSLGGNFGSAEKCVWVNSVENEDSATHEELFKKVKAIHKRRFRRGCDSDHIFGNTQNCKSHEPVGESDAALGRFMEFLSEACRKTALGDTRPLFGYNFLERLDETVDIGRIMKLVEASKRQVFIAVPHYYEIRNTEEMPYDTAVCTP